VVPTRHCRRADQALSTDDATAPHAVGEQEGKHSVVCPSAEGSPRIACANGSSSCGEALARPHSPNLHPADRSEQDRLVLNRHWCGERQETTETTDGADTARPISFGRLLPGTALSLAQRSLPSSCKTKSWAPKRPVARPNAAAHCQGPYSSAGGSEAPKAAGASLGGAHSISRSWPPCIICPKERRRFHTH
jgi:hypothetical protein